MSVPTASISDADRYQIAVEVALDTARRRAEDLDVAAARAKSGRGQELPRDLTVLCRGCHSAHHGKLGKGSP